MSEDLIRRSDAIKAIANLHILADEEKIFRVYADNPHSMTTDFEGTLIDAINAIKSIPTIEPKRGEWIGYNADKGDDWLRSDGEPIFLVCNKCHGTVINNGSAHWNFCPNCGADMREREGE